MTESLPEFLVIGAPRSGTTLLHRLLQEHPSLFLAQPREIYSAGDVHFFDVSSREGKENFNRGVDWYREHFRPAPEGTLLGEKTADYLADPAAPTLIHRVLGPSVKLIAILRDPVARAYSQYWYSRPHLFPKAGFTDALETSIGRRVLIEPGYYYRHLCRYTEHFSMQNLLIIIADDLYANPLGEAGRVCRFLGVDSSGLTGESAGVVNRAVVGGTAYWIERLGSWIRQRHPSMLERIKQTPGIGAVKRALASSRNVDSQADSRPAGYPSMAVRDQSRLERLYADDVQYLREFLGQDKGDLWPHVG